ncbi:MKRN2 opposite strand protein-like [Tubulanus polymorphus]|uniref:MKRN2 opposite strand protein-like n=1 Tax=Tubulanus polymorphus TaxID=672921 RepID=UPI003DA4D4FD
MAAPIYCFCHCEKRTKIFYSNFPQWCPVCGLDTERSLSLIPPYKIPSPFITVSQSPYSVVIRPTVGHFIESYTASDNLHIGITSSTGEVYDYDENGLNIGSDVWKRTDCLSIAMPPHSAEETTVTWDDSLRHYSQYPDWHQNRYHSDDHNCYDFVIGFFRYIRLASRDSRYASKISFTENVLLPETTKVAAYISLYRKIQQEGTVCQTSD